MRRNGMRRTAQTNEIVGKKDYSPLIYTINRLHAILRSVFYMLLGVFGANTDLPPSIFSAMNRY